MVLDCGVGGGNVVSEVVVEYWRWWCSGGVLWCWWITPARSRQMREKCKNFFWCRCLTRSGVGILSMFPSTCQWDNKTILSFLVWRDELNFREIFAAYIPVDMSTG